MNTVKEGQSQKQFVGPFIAPLPRREITRSHHGKSMDNSTMKTFQQPENSMDFIEKLG